MKTNHNLYRVKGKVTISNPDLTKPRTQIVDVNDLFADTCELEAECQMLNRVAPSYTGIEIIDEEIVTTAATPEEVEAWEAKENAQYIADHCQELWVLA